MDIVKCKIADFNVSFENDIKNFKRSMSIRDYLCDFDVADIYISISDDDVRFEEENFENETATIYPSSFKRAALFRKFAEIIPAHNAFVLHSATFDVEGTGVAFAAHSGTGKTTHMNRWKSYLGDKMTIVNGDKPIVRFFDDEPNVPYAYGTPWNGKEGYGCNMRTNLKHICFIERSSTNFVRKTDKKAALDRIFKQVYMPKAPMAIVKTMQLVDRLLSCCELWVIHCNMDDNAGEIAYKSIFEVENG